MQNRLKELRKAKGLTQAELAKVFNIKQSQYATTEDKIDVSNLTLFQKISFDKDAIDTLDYIIYSIHLLVEKDDEHSKHYVNCVTNYLSKIITFNVSSLGMLTPFHRLDKSKFEKEYQKYILPFEKAVLKIEGNLKEGN